MARKNASQLNDRWRHKMSKYYTNKQNANRAGVKEFGKDGFLIEQTSQGFKIIILQKGSTVAKHIAEQQKEADAIANNAVSVNRTISGIEVTHQSVIERPCKKVWHIADAMPGSKRKEVLAACVKAGIAYYTARTQYQQWIACNKEMVIRQTATLSVKAK